MSHYYHDSTTRYRTSALQMAKILVEAYEMGHEYCTIMRGEAGATFRRNPAQNIFLWPPSRAATGENGYWRRETFPGGGHTVGDTLKACATANKRIETLRKKAK